MDVIRANRVTGIVAIVLGAVITYEASHLPLTFAGSVGPALVPLIVGIGWIVCGVYLVIRPGGAQEELEEWPDRQAAMRIVGLLVIGAVHVALLQYVGFLIATWFLLFMGLWVMSDYGWLKRLAITLPLGLGLRLLFVDFLAIPLPVVF